MTGITAIDMRADQVYNMKDINRKKVNLVIYPKDRCSFRLNWIEIMKLEKVKIN